MILTEAFVLTWVKGTCAIASRDISVFVQNGFRITVTCQRR